MLPETRAGSSALQLGCANGHQSRYLGSEASLLILTDIRDLIWGFCGVLIVIFAQ